MTSQAMQAQDSSEVISVCSSAHCRVTPQSPELLILSNRAIQHLKKCCQDSGACCVHCWASEQNISHLLGLPSAKGNHGNKCIYTTIWKELKAQGLTDDHAKSEMIVRFPEEDTPEVEVREQCMRVDMADDHVASYSN